MALYEAIVGRRVRISPPGPQDKPTPEWLPDWARPAGPAWWRRAGMSVAQRLDEARRRLLESRAGLTRGQAAIPVEIGAPADLGTTLEVACADGQAGEIAAAAGTRPAYTPANSPANSPGETLGETPARHAGRQNAAYRPRVLTPMNRTSIGPTRVAFRRAS